MASKGGVLAVAGIVGVGALLAFTATAKASTKPSPVDQTKKDLCTAHKAERKIAANQVVYLKGVLIDIDAARIQLAMNNEDTTALDNQRANVVANINKFQSRVNELDGLIAQCS